MLQFLFLFFGLFDGFPRFKNRKTLRFQSDDRRHTKIVAISVICCAIQTNGVLPRPVRRLWMFMRIARPSALDDGGCGLLGFLANSWQNGLLVTIAVERESEN